MTKGTIFKKIITMIGVITFMTTLTGCIGGRRREIEGMFADYFAIHPTEDLREFLNFPREHRELGIVTISTAISPPKPVGGFREGDIVGTGMNLNFNEKTGEVTGEYFIQTQGELHWQIEQENIKVYLSENGIKPVENLDDDELEKQILNFKFLPQLLILDEEYIRSLTTRNLGINKNTNTFNIFYNIPNNDENFMRVREHFNIPNSFENNGMAFFGYGFGERTHHSPRREVWINFGEGADAFLIISDIWFSPINEEEK